jgi:hypothetical protein
MRASPYCASYICLALAAKAATPGKQLGGAIDSPAPQSSDSRSFNSESSENSKPACKVISCTK